MENKRYKLTIIYKDLIERGFLDFYYRNETINVNKIELNMYIELINDDNSIYEAYYIDNSNGNKNMIKS